MSDLISRKEAIEKIESHTRVGDELYPLTDTDKILNHAFEIAASCVYNLPSAQPETADCIYCHEDSDGYVKPIEKNCHACIRFGMNGWEISLSAKGWNGSAKIMYCPMCGRRLSE